MCELNLYIKDKPKCDDSARKMDKITVIAADIGKQLAYLINRKQDSDYRGDEESETEILLVETQIASYSASSSEEEELVKFQAPRFSKFYMGIGNQDHFWKINTLRDRSVTDN